MSTPEIVHVHYPFLTNRQLLAIRIAKIQEISRKQQPPPYHNLLDAEATVPVVTVLGFSMPGEIQN